ncbi:hypothetical protein [Streptomyces silvisoli]|uniref:Uncharacterized protein n=1 Tax=Streptomyces silvisoli TaxID=3034235 RepID=A0ABT5ZRE8_9ACTN|nr:hypothetical protein [Streptomyces silvisoli]MDF3292399.1 hypothetical protein [Streptomyces silvisoli]
MPHTPAPSPDQIAQATTTLAQVKDYLRTNPPAADLLPLLAPLLDEDTGVPILLGNILRSAARLIEGQALLPWPVEVRRIIARLRAAAPEVTDCYDLHQDIHRLGALPFDSPLPSASCQ